MTRNVFRIAVCSVVALGIAGATWAQAPTPNPPPKSPAKTLPMPVAPGKMLPPPSKVPPGGAKEKEKEKDGVKQPERPKEKPAANTPQNSIRQA